jgi:hypothetical protein
MNMNPIKELQAERAMKESPWGADPQEIQVPKATGKRTVFSQQDEFDRQA